MTKSLIQARRGPISVPPPLKYYRTKKMFHIYLTFDNVFETLISDLNKGSVSQSVSQKVEHTLPLPHMVTEVRYGGC